jgi:TolB-like protein
VCSLQAYSSSHQSEAGWFLRAGIGCLLGEGTATESSVHRFGSYALDLRTGKVAGPAGDLLLRPKAHALLTYLAKNPGRVVPKSELLEAVWPNVYVQEDSLTQAIAEVRRALADDATLLRNVPRRGYMLTGNAERDTVASRSEPVVAILRFRNDDRSTDSVLIDGFAEDIISGLARFGTLIVLSRASSFTLASFERAVGHGELGADYIVEGAMSRRGDQAIITVGLTDARTGARVWGERYEANGVEMFAVQREIATEIVSRLVGQIGQAALRNAQRAEARDLTEYDLVIRAAAILDRYGSEDLESALRLLDEAIERDASYAPPHAYRALAIAMQGGMGGAAADVLASARESAIRATVCDPAYPVGYRILATIQLYQRQHDAAEATLRSCLELNPSDADAVGLMGHLLILRGRPIDGRAWLDRAARLNPFHRQWYDFSRALAAYQLAEYDESVRLVRQLPETIPFSRELAAAATAMKNRSEITRADSGSGYAIPDTFGWEHVADRAHVEEGMRRARMTAST